MRPAGQRAACLAVATSQNLLNGWMSGGSDRACIDKGGGWGLPGCAALLKAGAPAHELGAGCGEQAIGKGRMVDGVEIGGAVSSAARPAEAAYLAVDTGLVDQLVAALFCMGQQEVVGLVQT